MLIQSSANLSKTLMPLDKEAIDQDVEDQNALRISKRMGNIKEILEKNNGMLSFQTQSEEEENNDLDLHIKEGKLFEEIEFELEEKSLTIKELETENHNFKGIIQRQQQTIKKLEHERFKIIEKKVLSSHEKTL